MNYYMKSFVFASLFYLGLGVIIGLLNGIADLGYFGIFAHTHLNLLGFMSMIIFGIGYFILPRFNGVDLKFPSWVTIHFYLGNLSLVGMVSFRGMEMNTGDEIFKSLFIICATLQAVSIFMFIINITFTLLPKKVDPVALKKEPAQPLPQAQPTAQPIAPSKSSFDVQDESTLPNMQVTAETKVSDLVDRLPSLMDVLVDCGLMSLQMPGHIDKVRKMGITIGMAAANHSLDLDTMIFKLETELQRNGFSTTKDFSNSTADVSTIDTNTLIGEVIANYPKATPVFQKYFGDGCFDCPGQSYESIDMACRIHNVDPDTFLKELLEALG